MTFRSLIKELSWPLLSLMGFESNILAFELKGLTSEPFTRSLVGNDRSQWLQIVSAYENQQEINSQDLLWNI